jgi:hypothetical protein
MASVPVEKTSVPAIFRVSPEAALTPVLTIVKKVRVPRAHPTGHVRRGHRRDEVGRTVIIRRVPLTLPSLATYCLPSFAMASP